MGVEIRQRLPSGGPAMIALTRAVSPTLAECHLTHLERVPIDIARATVQHATFEAELSAAGCRGMAVAPAPGLPDAVFVEDTAVVLPEVAVIARPGAPARRPEVDAVAAVLSGHRPLARIAAPGTLDGGDVLVIGRTVFVGATARSNREGATQLERILAPRGYAVRRVPVAGCLHLKSAVTRVDDDTLILNPDWVEPHHFDGYRTVHVDPLEPQAANVLSVRGRILVSAAHPRTADRLTGLGTVVAIDVSELSKAEAGLTCCCILLD